MKSGRQFGEWAAVAVRRLWFSFGIWASLTVAILLVVSTFTPNYRHTDLAGIAALATAILVSRNPRVFGLLGLLLLMTGVVVNQIWPTGLLAVGLTTLLVATILPRELS